MMPLPTEWVSSRPKPERCTTGGPSGNVVGIGVGVEEEVRRVHHPDAAIGAHGGVGHIEAVLEDRVLVVDAVVLGRLVDGDDVGAAVVVGRSRGNAVVVRAVILIAADHVDACGIRVLPILRDPEAAAGVEAEVGRLGDERLGQQQVDREIRRRTHLRIGVGRRKLRAVELFGATEHAVRFAELRERGGSRLHLERRTRDQRRRGIFPGAFKDALHEVVHDERRFAEEAALPCGLLDAEDDFIPLALLQRAHRDLVAEDLLAGALVGRCERAARADLHAVDEEFVRAFKVAEMKADRFLEQVALVLGEEGIVHPHPSTIPGVGRGGRTGGGRRDRSGHLSLGEGGAKPSEAKQQERTEGHGVACRQAKPAKVATLGGKRDRYAV
jgi:hypothetical protein